MNDLNASHPVPQLRAFFGAVALLLLAGCPGGVLPIDETEGSTGNQSSTGTTTGITGITTIDPCGTGCDDTPVETSSSSDGQDTTADSTGGSTGSTGGSSGSTGGSTGSTGSTGGESSSGGTTEAVSAGSSSSSSDGGMDTGVVFIMDPDGGVGIECSSYLQDCPVGDKCMPWDNGGGGSWNALGCFPIDPAPVGEGETCLVQGSGTSGLDNCELGHMCWDVDAATNEGTCVALCTGSPVAPVCAPPGTSCVIANDGVLNLCLPGCDPLLQDCNPGAACYPINDGFTCAPDASGAQGVDGDPCEFINVCDPGLMCANAASLEGCFGAAGCCTPFCDVTVPGDPCPAVTEECVPFYELGMAPLGFEDVGVCAIP
jgi:hypothetical protein